MGLNSHLKINSPTAESYEELPLDETQVQIYIKNYKM